MGACTSKASIPLDPPSAPALANSDVPSANANPTSNANEVNLKSSDVAATGDHQSDPSVTEGINNAKPFDELGEEEKQTIAVVEDAVPHLAGTQIIQVIARSLSNGEKPTDDDDTFRAPAVELMRLFDKTKCGALRRDELDAMLLTFARSTLEGQQQLQDHDDDADVNGTEVREAISSLNATLEQVAKDPAAGITVDDLEDWLERMAQEDNPNDHDNHGEVDNVSDR